MHSNASIELVSEGVCDSLIMSTFRGLFSAAREDRGAEEDKIKEQDLESSSILSAPLFLTFSSFILGLEAGAASGSLCPSTEPKAYLSWLFSMSVLPHTPPTAVPPRPLFHFFFPVIFFSPYCTWSGNRRQREGLSNGFPSGCCKRKDLRSKTCFFSTSLVTLWIQTVDQVKPFAPVLHNRCPLREANASLAFAYLRYSFHCNYC